ncbi:MAG: DNA repair protein RecO [Armatimonadota bacterium]
MKESTPLPTYAAEGVALVARAFRGTGRMVNFYTRERGLVTAVAQGIGKPGSSLAPVVEPFTYSKLHFAETKGADRLTQARVIEPFYSLRRNMSRFGFAAVACELIARTIETGQEVPGLFEMLIAYLHAMERTDSPRVLSWAFELAYLEMSGIAPVIDRCPACGSETLGGAYDPAHGGTLCAECAPDAGRVVEISPGAARTIEAMMQFDPAALERLRLTEATRHQVQRLIRDHIRYHLDLNLKSEQFVESIGRWRPPPRRRRPDVEKDAGGGEDDE